MNLLQDCFEVKFKAALFVNKRFKRFGQHAYQHRKGAFRHRISKSGMRLPILQKGIPCYGQKHWRWNRVVSHDRG
ncbi:hypothetical protein BC351_33210 [Paenibacillus ferrarius]|uniref:Uncharacterized protein n=1 Tax=Paenibacillus ferrarius TaxID=1469647 RepID=A0A1V4HEA7_9BACL|nr:hypothetical protein BC351_33210 [Paenibacillus ferrarius]